MVSPGGYSFQNQTASSAEAGGDTRLTQGGISFGSFRAPGSFDGRTAAITAGVSLLVIAGLYLMKSRKG